jgi:hypothetical protein
MGSQRRGTPAGSAVTESDSASTVRLRRWVTSSVCMELVADARLASVFRPSVMARTPYLV